MRGSDPDAALYWLAKMIHAGEDPRFITRRMLIAAAEDVGLADPMALVLANAAHHAAEFVGWPEARIPIAEAAIYLATANKSNSAITAIDAALADVKSGRTLAVPEHLRDGHYKGNRCNRPSGPPPGSGERSHRPRPITHGSIQICASWWVPPNPTPTGCTGDPSGRVNPEFTSCTEGLVTIAHTGQVSQMA